MSNNLPADAEIVRRITDGDVNAYEHLVKKYKRYVFKIVNKHIPYEQVEETAQDVFVRAYQSLPNFKKKSSFKQWLAKITVRTCYDFWRKAYRNRELPMSSLTENQKDWLGKVIAEQASQAFYEEGAQKEAAEVLNYALDRMSAEDRMVLELIYLEGLSGK
ncbi:MAG: RNA polymerase sigma factor, partial [Deltaproteobacteria bacterium]